MVRDESKVLGRTLMLLGIENRRIDDDGSFAVISGLAVLRQNLGKRMVGLSIKAWEWIKK